MTSLEAAKHDQPMLYVRVFRKNLKRITKWQALVTMASSLAAVGAKRCTQKLNPLFKSINLENINLVLMNKNERP